MYTHTYIQRERERERGTQRIETFYLDLRSFFLRNRFVPDARKGEINHNSCFLLFAFYF